jgi:hypothetical protein
MTDIQNIFHHYITCALWSSTDNDGEPLDATYDISDLHAGTEHNMFEELKDFVKLLEKENVDWSDWSEEQVGHDFWLTRNGHGAGFWDRGLENGDVLTKWAKTFGSCDLYVGDDGLLYV